MPPKFRIKPADSWPKGVENRNKGLEWVLKHVKETGDDSGVFYFADDDNTYDIRLFEEVLFMHRRKPPWIRLAFQHAHPSHPTVFVDITYISMFKFLGIFWPVNLPAWLLAAILSELMCLRISWVRLGADGDRLSRHCMSITHLAWHGPVGGVG